MFTSEEHGEINDMMRLYKFIKDGCSHDNLQTVLTIPYVRQHVTELGSMKADANMWSSLRKNSSLGKLQVFFTEQLTALPSNSQFCERGVKESGKVSMGKQSEATCSIVALARSNTIEEAVIHLKAEKLKNKGSSYGEADKDNSNAKQRQSCPVNDRNKEAASVSFELTPKKW